MEAFINLLGNPALQRHLLAINPAHLAAAVKACNEFLSVKDTPSSSVRQADDEEEMTSVQTLSTKDRESIDNLAKTVQELAKQVAGLKKENTELIQSQQTSKTVNGKKTTMACWGCRKEGARGNIVRLILGPPQNRKRIPGWETWPARSSEVGSWLRPGQVRTC